MTAATMSATATSTIVIHPSVLKSLLLAYSPMIFLLLLIFINEDERNRSNNTIGNRRIDDTPLDQVQ